MGRGEEGESGGAGTGDEGRNIMSEFMQESPQKMRQNEQGDIPSELAFGTIESDNEADSTELPKHF